MKATEFDPVTTVIMPKPNRFTIKARLMPVLVILALMATSNCATLRTSKNENMGQLQIDSTLIMDRFYVDLFNENHENGHWNYTAIDGTGVETSGGEINQNLPYWYYVVQLIPAHDYYWLVQSYDEYGNITSRGKYSWKSVRGLGGGVTKVGNWEYYDENGVKTVMNEDAAHGEFTYEDVLRKLESRGILNRRTGKNREGLDIYFHPEERYWFVSIIDDAGVITGKGKYREIHIHRNTGRIIKDTTTPYMVIY
jgi:hypothetical protein